MKKNNRLVLGTVQLGLPYGIANRSGQPDQSEANAIIKAAWENGIYEFDTAQGYGVSEEVLGNALTKLGINRDVKIITKFHPGSDISDANAVIKSVDASLKRLNTENLYGILLHKEETLTDWDNGLRDIIKSLIKAGKIQMAGVSVYSPQKALQALNIEGIDIVQLPANILDRRFENAGIFATAGGKSKIVYIRSIYLQGLLLLKETDIPKNMSFVRPVLAKVESLCNERALSRQELAIGYVKAAFPDARVIFGAEQKAQIAENVSAWKNQYDSAIVDEVRKVFPDCEERILNPILWH